MAIYNEKKKKKKNTLGARRKKFAWLVPLASIRLTLLLLSLSMILVFVATLEQVRIGIRGALAEYFESMYGIWHYPEQFWGSEHLSAFPIPIPGGYLLGAALLKACDHGISKKMQPAAPESRNIYEAQKAGKDVKKLPLSLGEALERLSEDEVIKSAMPDEMYKVFHWYKNDEWEKFLGATTQWDLDTYLDCLP